MGMNRHDAYYEPNDCEDDDEFDELVSSKLKHENYPYSAENIQECFFDDGFEGKWETLAGLLKNGDTASAGIVLSSTLYTYWEERSKREVIDSI